MKNFVFVFGGCVCVCVCGGGVVVFCVFGLVLVFNGKLLTSSIQPL